MGRAAKRGRRNLIIYLSVSPRERQLYILNAVGSTTTQKTIYIYSQILEKTKCKKNNNNNKYALWLNMVFIFSFFNVLSGPVKSIPWSRVTIGFYCCSMYTYIRVYPCVFLLSYNSKKGKRFNGVIPNIIMGFLKGGTLKVFQPYINFNCNYIVTVIFTIKDLTVSLYQKMWNQLIT